MNRTEFLRRLERALQGLPAEERRRAMEYYQNYFDEAGEENEEEVIHTLGSPESVAEAILREFRDVGDIGLSETKEPRNTTERARNYYHSLDSNQRILLILLTVIAAACILPVMFGLIGGIGGVIVGILAVMLGIMLLIPCLCLAAWGFAALCLVGAVLNIAELPFAILLAGCGCLCIAFGLIFGKLSVYLCGTVFPAAVGSLLERIRYGKKEEKK